MCISMANRTRDELLAEIKTCGIEIVSIGEPLPANKLVEASQQLSQELPPPLQELYLAFDGLRGPTNAAFLWPLFGHDGLVSYNIFVRRENYAPSWIGTVIFFGGDGVGDYWGIEVSAPHRILSWRPIDLEEFDVAGTSIIEVWKNKQQEYDSVR